jgi:hypothetical protein
MHGGFFLSFFFLFFKIYFKAKEVLGSNTRKKKSQGQLFPLVTFLLGCTSTTDL